ncbi:sigma-70 family RNA polymerase sigma factor [Actinoplanes sp. LDG1-06]|uniref:Sigma-70 family RNA polymerase sigma factor n=1 Tax=Paractinoplanes ovalisporus TaxID=2810368 RepID=A0ABS2A7L6_9ACTN|nr:sigma-70 family RNA polymerase sigma factor [Actinoplanes ovalisporus]MBM2615823.1 sigma-70 family RNA polymerase sigma factor [Actinoplanes ovalisporus]
MPTRQPVEQMLRDLPPQQREILVATFFRRRTTREAAQQLGLAPEVARTRLYNAMCNLSDMITTGGRERTAARLSAASARR